MPDRANRQRSPGIAAAALAAVATIAGCGDPPPPPRATYVEIWAEAMEAVVRDQALAGGAERLAAPRPEDEGALAEALAKARTGHGLDGAAWRRAMLAHEADTRDELHLQASDLVHGWAQIANAPLATLGSVMGRATESALGDGWVPEEALWKAAVDTYFRVSYEPKLNPDGAADPTPRGLKQQIEDLIPPENAAEVGQVKALVDSFQTSANDFVDRLLEAVPRRHLARALSDQRLTDRMWDHALRHWHEGPAELHAARVGDSEGGYSLLTALDDRAAEVQELAQLIDAWKAAGDAGAPARWVARCREEARQYLIEQLQPDTEDRPPRALPAGDGFTAVVQGQVVDAIDGLARSDVTIRMLRLRQAKAMQSQVQAAVAAEIAGARATAALSSARVSELARAAVRAVGRPAGAAFTLRFKLRNLAVTEGLEQAAEQAGIPAAQLPYLRWRMEVERAAVTALDEAIADVLGE